MKLAYERVALSTLTLDPRNARKHDKRNIEAIKASLTKFGQQKPIVVSSDGVVIAGNGTLAAAKELGWVDIDVHFSGLTGETAAAYALIDNRSAELAAWDDGILGELLDELKVADWDLSDLGWNDADVAKILGNGSLAGDIDPNKEWDGMPEFDQDDKESFRKIIVHFESNEDADAFATTIGQTLTEKTRSIWFPEKENMETEAKRYE